MNKLRNDRELERWLKRQLRWTRISASVNDRLTEESGLCVFIRLRRGRHEVYDIVKPPLDVAFMETWLSEMKARLACAPYLMKKYQLNAQTL